MKQRVSSKTTSYRITCGQCMRPIDEPALFAALNRKQEYVHACGRVLLFKGGWRALLTGDRPVEDVEGGRT